MSTRKVVIFSGHRFDVPSCIQRIDSASTHGWQVRYGGSKLFSDHSDDGSGARAALAAAVEELRRRIERLPAPSRLQRAPSARKTSGLPVGISGPVVRHRAAAGASEAAFVVSLPRFGQPARSSSVYIGTESTYTVKRYRVALAAAIELREQAERSYRRAATKARREDMRALVTR
jgi:hypothetical protein